MTTPSQGSGSAAEEMAESLGKPAVEEDQNKTPPSYEHGSTDTLTGSQQPQWLVQVLRAQNQARQYRNTEKEVPQKPLSIAEELLTAHGSGGERISFSKGCVWLLVKHLLWQFILKKISLTF